MSGRSLLYVEDKSGELHRGDAWIVLARTSRSGRTVYFGPRALHRVSGGAGRGNHVCAESGAVFWVSGPKREGGDRHTHGTGPILVERRALSAYLEHRGLGADELDPAQYRVVDDLPEPSIDAHHARANAPLDSYDGDPR